jgi:ATP-dependent Clp protease ATP-binding subunit ClpA
MMFERFTKDARAVVAGAVAHAGSDAAGEVGEEHFLLALLDRRDSRGSSVLMSLGLAGRGDEIRRDLAEARRRGGLSRADTEALSGLGIDLPEVVARLEEAHGEGVLDRSKGHAGNPDASNGGTGGGAARSARRLPLSGGSKDLLTRSLRIAVSRRDRSIGDEHLLLALTVRPGVPSEILADKGAANEAVIRVLDEADGGAAKAG